MLVDADVEDASQPVHDVLSLSGVALRPEAERRPACCCQPVQQPAPPVHTGAFLGLGEQRALPVVRPSADAGCCTGQTLDYISSGAYLRAVRASAPSVDDIQLAEFQDHGSPPINFDSAGAPPTTPGQTMTWS